MKWEIIKKLKKSKIQKIQDLVGVLLENRGLKIKEEIDNFINPRKPEEIRIEELGISKTELNKILKRLKTAKENKEKIVIFGDYDADGVCATAILWEAMYKLGYDVMPYIPDRFKEGYGLKASSFQKLQNSNIPNPNLLITVDNGIVAYDAIHEAKRRKIDVIVVDHHTKGTKKLDTSYVFHSTDVCGSALAWFLSRVLVKVGPSKQVIKRSDLNMSLDLVALGTIADQMPLLGVNRSLVKHGLPELTKTKRVGLKMLIKDLKIDNVGVYEIGYLIAPRINAMGRLESATDSLRFLCTKDPKRAGDLNTLLNETNVKRQKIVDEVLAKTLEKINEDKVIVISGKYHEGVIGLASGKITEKFYRPSIVLSENGDISKASARSVSGFNIIEAIKETDLILEGGGHPMAAGFSIKTSKIEEFRLKINELSKEKLTDEVLERKLYIDAEIGFDLISIELTNSLKQFEPSGQGNYSPIFVTKKVKIREVKPVGQEGKHLKLKLEQGGKILDAIWFNSQYKVQSTEYIDIAYSIEENIWNGKTNIQLKIRDIK